MGKKGELVAAVDFGARQVRVLIVERTPDGSLRYRGDGSGPSRGCVRHGQIQNQHDAQRALRAALEEARKKSGAQAQALFCGITSEAVRSVVQEGCVPLTKGIVELEHLESARGNAAQNALHPGCYPITSTSSQEWQVDGTRVIEPLGMRGSVLKAKIHVANIPSVAADNLRACIDSQGRILEDFVYQPIAAALGCLSGEDTQLGAAVVDIGHSGIGIAAYHDMSILGTAYIPQGTVLMVNDLSAGLKVRFDEAGEILQELGVSRLLLDQMQQEGGADAPPPAPSPASADAPRIKLKSPVNGAPDVVPRKFVDEIIFARALELAEEVARFLNRHRMNQMLARGIVLTGGGAEIRNFAPLLEAVCRLPVRIGTPEGLEGMPTYYNTPANAPITGIVRHGLEYYDALRSGRVIPRGGSPLAGRIRYYWEKIRELFF